MNQVEIVKQICKNRRVSIHKLEMDCGFSNGYISQLKNGVFPADRAAKIAEYFGISLEYLVNGGERNIDYVIRKESSETDPEVLSLIELYENASPDRRRLARIALGSPEQEP